MILKNLKIIILLCFTLNTFLSCNRASVTGSNINNNEDITGLSSVDLTAIIPPKAGSKFLYIANGGFPIYCNISQINGNILDCNNTGLNIDKAIGISIYKKYAFVLNRGENQIYKCYISNNGMLTYCSVNIISNLIQDSKHLTINNGYLYIGNYGSDSITYCEITELGDLKNCNMTGSNSNNAYSIRTNENYIYIGRNNTNAINVCYISTINGKLNTCNSSISISQPWGFAFLSGYFYATSLSDNAIYGSQISSNGTLKPVTLKFTHPMIQSPVSMTQDKNNFYLLTANANKVIQCVLDNSGMNLNYCSQYDGDLNQFSNNESELVFVKF